MEMGTGSCEASDADGVCTGFIFFSSFFFFFFFFFLFFSFLSEEVSLGGFARTIGVLRHAARGQQSVRCHDQLASTSREENVVRDGDTARRVKPSDDE
jgi:uncharacterized membrane protein required for colicin V production